MAFFRAIIISALFLVISAGSATAQETNPQKAARLVQEAENLCDQSECKKAEALLQEAKKLKPDMPELYKVLGNMYMSSDYFDYKEAENSYKQWAKLQPNESKPYEMLGYVAAIRENYAASNEYFAKAKELNPTRLYPVGYRCYNFLQLKKWQETIAECSEAITINPKDVNAYLNRGEAYEMLGDKTNAEKDYAQATAAKNERRQQYHSKYRSAHRDITQKLFPLAFIAMASIFMMVGLSIAIRKKPLLIATRWRFGVLLLCFSPMLTNLIVIDNRAGTNREFDIMRILLLLMLAGLLIVSWIQMQGYMAFGVKDKSFRKALISVLKEMKLKHNEELSTISIPSEGMELKVLIHSWAGVAQVTNKGRKNPEKFAEIISGLKKRFSEGKLEVNNNSSIYNIVFGLIMLALAISMLHFQN